MAMSKNSYVATNIDGRHKMQFKAQNGSHDYAQLGAAEWCVCASVIIAGICSKVAEVHKKK